MLHAFGHRVAMCCNMLDDVGSNSSLVFLWYANRLTSCTTANSINSKAIVWLCPLLLLSLRRASNSKESGLTKSLSKAKLMYTSKREKQMKMAQHKWPKLSIMNMVDSRRLRLLATTVQWTLPFCIALCSVDLFGSVVEYGLVLDVDGDEEWRKSLCNRRSRLLDTMKHIKYHTITL